MVKRALAARGRGETPAQEDLWAILDALELELVEGVSVLTSLGLTPFFRQKRLLADRDATIREHAAAIAGSLRDKAEKLAATYNVHPKRKPLGPSVGPEALRKILGNAPRGGSPKPTLDCTHEHSAPQRQSNAISKPGHLR